MPTSTNFRPFAAALMLACLCGGCLFTAGGSHSSGTHSVGSRKVQYALDGPGSSSSADGVISLSFDGGKLHIEKSRLLLDGQEVATFPEDTKTIFVKYASGELTITADGATIYPAGLAEDSTTPIQ